MTLLSRLAQAKGPDDELVKDVVRALCPKVVFQAWPGYDAPIMYHVEPVFDEKAFLPNLLASLDVVLRLLPEGWCCEVAYRCGEDGWYYNARVYRPHDKRDDAVTIYWANADTAPLALMQPILRARGIE
jgi:hypothetical protein